METSYWRLLIISNFLDPQKWRKRVVIPLSTWDLAETPETERVFHTFANRINMAKRWLMSPHSRKMFIVLFLWYKLSKWKKSGTCSVQKTDLVFQKWPLTYTARQLRCENYTPDSRIVHIRRIKKWRLRHCQKYYSTQRSRMNSDFGILKTFEKTSVNFVILSIIIFFIQRSQSEQLIFLGSTGS